MNFMNFNTRRKKTKRLADPQPFARGSLPIFVCARVWAARVRHVWWL
jgi:hypothetical protein